MSDISEKLTRLLDKLRVILGESTLESSGMPSGKSKKLKALVDAVNAQLNELSECLDPIQRPRVVFDPTNPEVIGRLIAWTLLEQGRQRLGAVSKFYGSGVYALYYRGGFAAFKPIWNMKTCFGFGKHGDAPETRGNTRSPWDTLHPGRSWATKAGNKPNPLSTSQISELIAAHFEQNPPKPTERAPG